MEVRIQATASPGTHSWQYPITLLVLAAGDQPSCDSSSNPGPAVPVAAAGSAAAWLQPAITALEPSQPRTASVVKGEQSCYSSAALHTAVPCEHAAERLLSSSSAGSFTDRQRKSRLVNHDSSSQTIWQREICIQSQCLLSFLLYHLCLLQELFFGSSSSAAGLQSCLHLPDRPALEELTAQQLKPALAAAETAVLQQLTSRRLSGQQLPVAAQQQQQQATLAGKADTVQGQQPQLPTSFAEVCSVLGLDRSSYQALLEEVALLAEVSNSWDSSA